jgi:photosystem II stability/assembly factor-like uncharacterized protein
MQKHKIFGMSTYIFVMVAFVGLFGSSGSLAQTGSSRTGPKPADSKTKQTVHAQSKPALHSQPKQFSPVSQMLMRAMDSVSLLTQELQLRTLKFKQDARSNSSASNGDVEHDWSYSEAQLYWLKQRAYPNDTIDWRAYALAYIAKLKMSALALLLPPGVAALPPRWENIGPLNLPVPYRKYYGQGATSGRVNAVAYSPANPQVMFLASAGGGLWKTTDGGQHWLPRADIWENTKISSVAISSDGNTVYVGTGDFDGGRSAYGFGIKKSTNGGDNWTGMLKTELKGYSVHRIIIDPDNPLLVLVTAGNNPFNPGQGKMFRTDNGGTSWSELKLASAEWTDGTCGAKSSSGERACFVVGNSNGGQVWRSFDQGTHWTKLTVPLSAQFQYLAVAASPTNPQVVYLLSGTDGHLFKSATAGNSWDDITGDLPGDYNLSQVDYDRVLACSTRKDTNEDVIYVGLIDIVASYDGGKRWESVGHTYQVDAYTHNDQHAIAINPSDPNELLIGNDGGIYKLQVDPANQHSSFDTTLNAGLTITQFYRAAFHPTDADTLLGGAQDNATPLSLGDLKNWKNVGGGDGGFAAINPKNPKVQYATGQGLSLIRTDDGWASSADVSGPWSQEIRGFIAPIALDPNDPSLLYAGTNYLWRRDDTKTGQEAWNPDSPHVGDQLLAAGDGKDALTYIAIASSDSNRIYTGSQEGQLWMSKDKGEHWSQIDAGLPKYWITSIAVNPSNPNGILVALSGTASKDGSPHPGHVWICDNTQAVPLKWRLITGSGTGVLPDIPVNAIALDPSNPKAIYYAGTDIGFFASKDGGATWQDASASLGLPNVQVNDIQYVRGTGYLMAATFGRGIWRIKLPIELKPSYMKVQSKASIAKSP